MHPSPQFCWNDPADIRAFVAERRFAMLVATGAAGPVVAHVPVIWMDDHRLAFHLSRANRIVPHLVGARALMVVNGPDGYVSPDWYGLPDQVPTWNYAAAELEGDVNMLPAADLPALIDALSHDSERRLAPKPIWRRDKMADGQFDRMLGAINGYVMAVDQWRGTRKLGQNKPASVRIAAADGVEAAGNTEMAAWMRKSIS